MTRTRTVLLAGWLVPGGGHWVLGRRRQAVVFFATITITFVFGMYLCDFQNVVPPKGSLPSVAYFVCHMLNGAETILATVATSGMKVDHLPRHFGILSSEVGTVYSAVASLLNLAILMDAFGIATGVKDEPKHEAVEKEVSA